MEEGRGGGRGGGLAAAQGQSGEGAAWVGLGWFFPTRGAAKRGFLGWVGCGGKVRGGCPRRHCWARPPAACTNPAGQSHGGENRSGEAEKKLKNKSVNL